METNKNVEKNSKSYLTFKINGETFAANVVNVQNILELSKITKIPRTPDYLLGVINLRGKVLPLIDTRIKLGLRIQMYTINTCILVLEININNKLVHLGVLVDKVEEVIEIEQEQIQPPPGINRKIKLEILDGMYRYMDDKFIMILNMNKIFATNELDDIIELSKKATADKTLSS